MVKSQQLFKKSTRFCSVILAILLSFGWTVKNVSFDALDQPLDALGHPVTGQTGSGKNHAFPAAYVVHVVLENRLDFTHAHAICKEFVYLCICNYLVIFDNSICNCIFFKYRVISVD